MKTLTVKKEKAKETSNAFVSEEDLVTEKLQRRIDYLQTWLESLLVDDDELGRLTRVERILNEIKAQSPKMVTYYILNNYGHKYFSDRNNSDTNFKVELASQILDYVRQLYPNYQNELLQSISDNNSMYAANYIYAGNL